MPRETEPLNCRVLAYHSAKELKLAGTEQYQLPKRSDHVFAFVQQQSMKVISVEDGKHRADTVHEGELFYISPNCTCVLLNEGMQQAELFLIRFRCEPQAGSGKKEEKRHARLFESADTVIRRVRLPQARSWVQEFQGSMETASVRQYYTLQSYLYAMAAALEQPSQQGVEARPKTGLIDYVESTIQFMNSQFHSQIDVEELAHTSGVSASRFYQVFQSYTGLSPLKYITRLRLDASMRILSSTMASIVEVSHTVGYPDEYYFSRLFKKQLGMAPTEYARLAKKRVATLVAVFAGDLAVLGIKPCVSYTKRDRPDPEQIVQQLRAARPELILSGPLEEDMYKACSAIAPVLVLDWKAYSWKERLIDISEELGLTSAANRWMSYYDMKVQNARIQIRRSLEEEEPLLLVQARQTGYRVFGPRRRKMKDLFYDDLQLTPPQSAQHISTLDAASLEELAEIGCSRVIFLVAAHSSRTYIEQLEEKWNQLVQDGQRRSCMCIGYNHRLNYNPIVHEEIIDEMVRLLVKDAL